MSETKPTSQQVFQAPVNAPGSHFGCTIIYKDKDLATLLSDAVAEVRQLITDIFSGDMSVRQSLLTQLNNVDAALKVDTGTFEALVTQISCQKKITQEIAYQHIVHTINFLVSASYHDSGSSLPKLPDLNSTVRGNCCWLFSAATSVPYALEHHIGAISDYLASNQDKSINNGNCYIFKLLSGCDNCTDGVLTSGQNGKGILSNFLDRIIPGEKSNSDFFCIEKKRNLTFKCGECICNVTRITESGAFL